MNNEHDIDSVETQEWLDALDNVFTHDGDSRAKFILQALLQHANMKNLNFYSTNTPYRNSIAPQDEDKIPADEIAIMQKLQAIIRWNAVVMVVNASHKAPELGGHLASYASASYLYEIGFNYFFKAQDLVYFQGHSSPGMYARAFLEGFLPLDDLAHFRQEIQQTGLSSYPHPWLMPNFWQFPTVSMGLGPIQAIYQARFLKYLEHRGIKDSPTPKVWAFLGDGEVDEVESLGALSIAARENLNNLIFVINCNLQKLDGPVRGNGKIIQELESIFAGAKWRVIKVVWGSNWDPLFERDTENVMQKRMDDCVDGEYQLFKFKDGAFVREKFFGVDPKLSELVAHLSDDEIWALKRGGLDPVKVYAAYSSAVKHEDGPVVILAKTVKAYGLGEAGEAMNVAHQQKKMTVEQLKAFRDRFAIPVNDTMIENLEFYKPDENSPEMQYLHAKRKALGGYLPRRSHECEVLTVPELDAFAGVLHGLGDREISTTMAFVRILTVLLKDAHLGKRIVPIVPDESRTFGMEGLFRQIGIYSPLGQLYEPVDKAQIMYYREDKAGQVFEEGINEAGAFCSFISAATAYSTVHCPMIPFYIYYSMFGFQRVGDLAWAAGDMQARGFLLGGTAGRTTLAGEGLQHQDGHSHILAGTIPNCVSYDPTYAYELAVIIQNGLHRMYVEQENIFYYITVMNENYTHPDMPQGSADGILRGIYLLKESSAKQAKYQVQLLGSGTILREVLQAAEILEQDFAVAADVFSVTSFNELTREGNSILRHNRLHPEQNAQESYVSQVLNKKSGIVVAATDYIKLYAEQIRPFIKQPYITLGTDGFGRSDTRAELRHFFEVNAHWIVISTLSGLVEQGLDKKVLQDAIKKYNIDVDKPEPTKV
jgi:pyruvate dehydrogenase E1 component